MRLAVSSATQHSRQIGHIHLAHSKSVKKFKNLSKFNFVILYMHLALLFLSDEGPTVEKLDFTMHIGKYTCMYIFSVYL